MSTIKKGQNIGKYTFQSLIKENTYTGIYDGVTEENRELVLEAANKVNSKVKVAKVIVPDDDVWVLFEVILDQSPEVGSIIKRGLGILSAARQAFYEALN